jgi:hypothetical protein
MTNEQKNWIDNASYKELFRRQRFAPIGDPLFQGECGDYLLKRIMEIRPDRAECVRISKEIGW